MSLSKKCANCQMELMLNYEKKYQIIYFEHPMSFHWVITSCTGNYSQMDATCCCVVESFTIAYEFTL